jgi:alpha-glucosidase
VGRDPCRTPMQWTAGANAGFSSVEPWLPLADNFTEINVETETADPTSMLNLYRKILLLRKQHAALAIGGYQPVATTGDLLAYIRTRDNERFFVALNLGAEPHSLSLAVLGLAGRTLLSTHMDREDENPTSEFSLRAHEGIIVQLSA